MRSASGWCTHRWPPRRSWSRGGRRLEAEGVAALEAEPAEFDRLGADRLDTCFGRHGDAALGRDQAEDARRADQHAADVVARPEVGSHRELVGVREPAVERLVDLLDQLLRHVRERRRAGAAVEELVGAADGEVDPVPVDIDRNEPGGVGEIPHHECAGVAGPRSLGRDVDDLRRSVVDHRADDHGHVVEIVEARTDLELAGTGDRVDDVPVGREVRRIDGDYATVGPQPQTGADQLVQVDRGRVVHDDLSLAGTDQRGQAVAHPHRELEPASLPARDQIAPPLTPHHLVDTFERAPRRHPERVAVEVGQFGIGHEELVAPVSERVGSIEFGRPFLEFGDHPDTL